MTQPNAPSNDWDGSFGEGYVLVNVHPSSDDCWQFGCPIHAPSEHKMATWPLNWRNDRNLMERLCKHGVGHPDPDHIAFSRRKRGDQFADAESIHGCDGCCL